MTIHGIVSGTEIGGLKTHGSIPASDSAAIGSPGIGERIVVGIDGNRGDLNCIANHDGGAVRGAAHCRWTVGAQLHTNRGRAIGPSAASVVYAHFYRVC